MLFKIKTIKNIIDIIRGRKKLEFQVKPIKEKKESAIINKYLTGLNGIEIGGCIHNSYYLEEKSGAYANIDIITAKERARKKRWKTSQLVNVLSSGDELPFKDEVFDYVFSSHVIEHFFDPIKALKEWLRVLKKGGYIAMVIPHKERTFDKDRKITSVNELLKRHNGNITFSDYAKMNIEEKRRKETPESRDFHKLIENQKIPENWERFNKYDFGHHWSVWDTQAFIELCKELKLNIIEAEDRNDKASDSFTIIIKKQQN